MANNKKINGFLKHKRIIIFSLVAIGLLLMIFLTYILTYANNKPKPFSDDDNVKVVKKCEYFDFNCVADEISLGKTSYIKVFGEIRNVTQTLSDVEVTFEVRNNWTSKGEYTSDSAHKIASGEIIHPTKSSEEAKVSATTKLSLNTVYPIKVLPLVKVSKPIIYAKVKYSRKLPDSREGKGGFVEEIVYLKFTYNDYVTSSTTVIS